MTFPGSRAVLSGSEKPLLAAYGLTWSYSNGKASSGTVLDAVSFELGLGEFVALVGPNAAGKSTLLKLVAGVLPSLSGHLSGQVRFRGEDLLGFVPQRRARSVSYVGADLRADFPLTALEAVLLGRVCQGFRLFERVSREELDSALRAMEMCRCSELRDRDLNTLSGGERQLVALARALFQGAPVVFLDESLSRMDLNHQVVIGDLLRGLCADRKLSVVLVSHDLNVATEWADQCWIMQQGQMVASGDMKSVLTGERLERLYPGGELILGENPWSRTPKVFFRSRTQR
jgi:iron complex transport system ATP-binding protein